MFDMCREKLKGKTGEYCKSDVSQMLQSCPRNGKKERKKEGCNA